jgi:branched-subunit amino acid aminotransferase/4-amino-4-deoxychorismate lyase
VLLEEINVPGITVSEHEFTPSELETADQVFITSTTRDLLPVLEVDGEPLKQDGRVMGELRNAFLKYRDGYVARVRDNRIAVA